MLAFFQKLVMAVMLVLPAVTAQATVSSEQAPEKIFVQKLGEEALRVLADKSISKDQAKATFKQMLNDNFDVPAISRFVLGRYWNIATPAQQQEYGTLFNRMVEKIYTDRFGLYSGETFNVLGVRPDEQGGDKTVLSQVVRPEGPPVNVDWRVRNVNGTFKIVDVVVEGVSMSVTQRAEFASVIQRGGGNLEALLAMLRERTAMVQNASTN